MVCKTHSLKQTLFLVSDEFRGHHVAVYYVSVGKSNHNPLFFGLLLDFEHRCLSIQRLCLSYFFNWTIIDYIDYSFNLLLLCP